MPTLADLHDLLREAPNSLAKLALLGRSEPAYKLGTFTADISVSGDISVTDVGFTPKMLILVAAVNGTPAFSIGFYDGTNSYCVCSDYVDSAGSYALFIAKSVVLASSAGASAQYVGKSMDALGFTLTNAKTGAPTGSATVFYLALRQ